MNKNLGKLRNKGSYSSYNFIYSVHQKRRWKELKHERNLKIRIYTVIMKKCVLLMGFLPYDSSSLHSDTCHVHIPRSDITQNSLIQLYQLSIKKTHHNLIDRSTGDIFKIEVISSKITIACVKLTEN